MNENAKKWVEALRSGAYQQGRGALRRGNEYCCLGVACDLYDVAKWRGGANGAVFRYYGEPQSSASLLTEDVANWLGLATDAGYFSSEEGDSSLTNLNDDGASFEQIAAIIESEPSGLFKS